MAGERTEAATPKRQRDAREKGQVARSADLAAGLNLLAAALVLRVAGAWAGGQLLGATRAHLDQLSAGSWQQGGWEAAVHAWTVTASLSAAPVFLVLLSVGMVGGALQTGFLVSSYPLRPRFDRLNPLQGLQQLFTLRSLAEMGKSLLKAAVIAAAGWQAGRRAVDLMPELAGLSVAAAVPRLWDACSGLLLQSGALLAALGLLDYGYQWWETQRQLRMTKQEVKEEHRQSEGSPEVRGRRRQRMREIAQRQRMVRAMPTASVAIVNPTHVTVALRYRPGIESSPVVVAKGKDRFALRLRRLAQRYGVPVVEDQPLARAIYRSVPVGREVHPEFYRAVARIFAFLQQVRPER